MFLPTVLLTASAVLSFFWHNNPSLSPLSLQLIAGLFLLFVVLNKLVIKYQNIINSIIITLIVLLLILETGSLVSPLFFLLDFLLFTLSLLIFPSLGFILSLALTLLFLLNSTVLDTTQLANLISLLLMAPVARFIGNQYLKLLTAQKQINVLSNQSEHLKKNVSAQEEATLLWLSLNFHNKMHQTIDLLSQINSNLSRLPYHQKEKLNTLYQDLKELFKSGQELKEIVEKLNE
ncbi:MAG: hypothetical protein NTZ93_00070 [Candidatus Beckwithbacteria bacterium]|nr:hypothetical protein [Candidatus Beckwithbacteria bacterium]